MTQKFKKRGNKADRAKYESIYQHHSSPYVDSAKFVDRQGKLNIFSMLKEYSCENVDNNYFVAREMRDESPGEIVE